MATKSTATKQVASTGKAIERKALAMDSKSDGMRLLYDNGYTVAQVKATFGVPYGFAYGVALRHGVIATAANRRQPAKAKATRSARPAKAAAKPAPRVAKKATASKPSTASATSRVAAKLAAKAPAAKAKGRPTAARRAANRKSTVEA